MYNLIEYTEYYWKITGVLWQNSRDEPAINAANDIIFDFIIANFFTDLFKNKEKNDRWNRKQCHKRWWNSGTIKISK